ncbi:unnamed protein product [Polarella glacialis]|uniref:Secreted protein n=1 Tax=Polarella glacialis TaxID=89957 RepID=A0A813K9M9_POLGL|nr:unnamed protein product [Polarella glacialis]
MDAQVIHELVCSSRVLAIFLLHASCWENYKETVLPYQRDSNQITNTTKIQNKTLTVAGLQRSSCQISTGNRHGHGAQTSRTSPMTPKPLM